MQTDASPSLGSGEIRIRSVKDDDLAWELLRLRQLLRIGLACWVLFVGLDGLVVLQLDTAPFQFFLACRAFGAVVLIGCLLALEKWSSKLALRVVDIIAFGVAALVISIMALGVGGVRSPYVIGVIQVLVVRATAMPSHWKSGLVLSGIPATIYPVTMLVASMFVPSIAAQLADTQLATLFVADLAGIYGCLFLVVLGSDAGWRLRCQLFEAKMIGRYRLLERVGAGGMGEVWRAHDRSLKTDVALKFLKLDRVDDTHIARFEREVSATSKLKHPNTVRVSDFGWTDEGYLYYAMEFLEGETLHEKVVREGSLASPEAKHLFLQVASALGEAHNVGFVHRDVKPANVMIATLGGVPNQAKLLDFGLVKMTGNTRTGLTATGWTGGTPSYMAPEVIMGLDADSRSDVYSFGAMMYYVLTGQTPFATASDLATLRAHVEAPLIPPSVHATRPIAVDLERIVVRCLEKHPEQRYRDCVEVAAQLAEIDLSVVVASQARSTCEPPAEETRTFEG